MSSLEFFGRGSIDKLNNILFSFRPEKVLLVTGKSSYDNCPIKEKIEAILKNYTVLRYCDFDVNPKAEDLIKGADLVEEFDPDTVLAIGGGSVLDTGKILSVLPADTGDMIKMIKGEIKVGGRARKLILIPTTAGSGSEATHFAVAYIDKMKYSMASAHLLPDATILDAVFTDTMSKELTAITAFDAFCQAVESFWSLGSTEESRKYAREALEIILEVFDDLMKTPDSLSRDRMMTASHLSGKAINISKTTVPHALSYALTQYFDVPHGLAVMLLLRAFFKVNTDVTQESLNKEINFKEYVARIDALKKTMGVVSLTEAVEKIHKMLLSAGFKPELRAYGLNSSSGIQLLAESINVERAKNNPVVIQKEQLVSLLGNIY